ncbi:MAG: radical SAM protein [Candidatus Eremiobacteraeota bacterium]|nr:radical SAM protein [Candidatus Eremiobacteraeota bacterium]
MHILLVAQNINEQTNQELATPFGLLCLIAYVKKHMGDTVCFTLVDGLSEIPDDRYDMAGISSMSLYYPRALALATRLKKEHGIPVILGGPHATHMHHVLDRVFDVAVIGEGEETFLELVRLLDAKGRYEPHDLALIKGIAYQEEGAFVSTPPRPLIEPLDSLPFPDRSHWDLKGRIKWVISSRGCPYGCIFCSIARSKYRQTSVDYFVEEVKYLKNTYHSDIIAVQDDLFCASKTRLAAVVEGLEREGLRGRVGFGVSMRADLLDEESVKLLKAMKVLKVFVGAESGSEPILQYYKDGKLSVAEIQHALDLCFEYDIKVEGSFIIGAPGETAEDLMATYRFTFDNYKAGKLGFAAINILTPYPGSKVWEYAASRGLVSDTMDWTRLDLNLRNFDPYRCVYLNEKIPLVEFVDYLEIFEELNAITTGAGLPNVKGKAWASRLDRERINKFKAEPAARE